MISVKLQFIVKIVFLCPKKKWTDRNRPIEFGSQVLCREIKYIFYYFLLLVADELEDEFLQAVYQGNTSIAESCIERGIDPNITDDEDLTPLHHSAIRGDVSMGQMLLSASATEKDKRNPDEGCTALMYACIYGNEQFVKLLLENGVNPNLINNKLETALHLACVQNSLNISRHLISNGANLDVRDAFDNSPLSIAAIERGSIPLTALLLKKGAQAAGVKEFPLILGKHMPQFCSFRYQPSTGINLVETAVITSYVFQNVS